jgi:FkbM family methyltransferase
MKSVWTDDANEDQRLKRIAIALRFQMRGRVRHLPTRVPYGRNSAVLARLDGLSSRRAAYSRYPDFREMITWQRTLRAGDLFVDVGANIGLYTLIALETGANVIAIEPQSTALEQLLGNLELNRYSADVVPSAVAQKPGRLAMSGRDPNRQALVDRTGQKELVDVTTLDRVIGDRVVHGVKIDVEGAERLVLEGAACALREHRVQLIQLEWNRTSLENFGESRTPTARLLADLGYEFYRPDALGGLKTTSIESYGADVFARPRSSPVQLHPAMNEREDVRDRS